MADFNTYNDLVEDQLLVVVSEFAHVYQAHREREEAAGRTVPDDWQPDYPPPSTKAPVAELKRLVVAAVKAMPTRRWLQRHYQERCLSWTRNYDRTRTPDQAVRRTEAIMDSIRSVAFSDGDWMDYTGPPPQTVEEGEEAS